MKEKTQPKCPTAVVVFSSELPPPVTIARATWLVGKPSSRTTIPPNDSLPLELGKEKCGVEILGSFDVFSQLPYLGMELVFVLVRKVVEEIERKMLLKFGSYLRSSESVAGRRC